MVSADWASGIAEVMYWLDAHWRGRGFSSAALRLVCDWTFRTLGLWRIELVMNPGNLPSRRTARAAGFRPDGTAPARKAGGPELVRYALVREPHQVVPVAHERRCSYAAERPLGGRRDPLSTAISKSAVLAN